MTAQEKANDLVNKYTNASFNCKNCDMPFCDGNCTQLSISESKECAIIVVDEILDSCIKDISHLHYWVAVKAEIEKL